MAWPAAFLERLQRRLASLDGPLIQVWSRPGSGARLLLDALRPSVHEIAPAVLTEPEAFATALEAAERVARETRPGAGGRPGGGPDGGSGGVPGGGPAGGQAVWLLVTGTPTLDVAPALARLTSRHRLLLFTHHRLELDLPPSGGQSWLTPDDFRLTARDVVEFWRQARGVELSPEAAAELAQASEGWLRVLELAADSDWTFDPEPFDPEAKPRLDLHARELRELPAVATFLRTVPGSDLASSSERFDTSAAAPPPAERARVPAAETSWDDDIPDFRVRLFGLPAVERLVSTYGEPPRYREVDFTLRRCFKLLLYLAAAPDHRVGKEELVEVLWSEEDEDSVQRNFHPTLSHLRRDLAGGTVATPTPIVFRNRSYQLNPELCWFIDVDRFESWVVEAGRQLNAGNLEASVQAGRQAWRLYRGPFLDGQYEAWTHARRDDLQRSHLRLLQQLGDTYLRLDRPVDALDAYRAVITEDPLEESVQVAILRLYAAQGRRDLVRRQYDKLCTLLLSELGVEPLPETTAEYHRLMA